MGSLGYDDTNNLTGQAVSMDSIPSFPTMTVSSAADNYNYELPSYRDISIPTIDVDFEASGYSAWPSSSGSLFSPVQPLRTLDEKSTVQAPLQAQQQSTSMTTAAFAYPGLKLFEPQPQMQAQQQSPTSKHENIAADVTVKVEPQEDVPNQAASPVPSQSQPSVSGAVSLPANESAGVRRVRSGKAPSYKETEDEHDDEMTDGKASDTASPQKRNSRTNRAQPQQRKKSVKASSSSSSPDHDSEDDDDVIPSGGKAGSLMSDKEKRALRKTKHQAIELRRRQKMTALFDDLRTLCDCDSADKVGTLAKAVEKIRSLQARLDAANKANIASSVPAAAKFNNAPKATVRQEANPAYLLTTGTVAFA